MLILHGKKERNIELTRKTKAQPRIKKHEKNTTNAREALQKKHEKNI